MSEKLNAADRQLLDMLDHPPTIEAETPSGTVVLGPLPSTIPVTPLPPAPPKKKARGGRYDQMVTSARERGDALCGDFGGESRYSGEVKPCAMLAGHGTEHKGTGRCMHHEQAVLDAIAEKKARFLELYANQPTTMVKVANELGVTVIAIFQWRKTDPDFDQAVCELRDDADDARLELVEDASFTRIINPAAPADTLRIFWMTNRGGGRWADRRALNLSGSNGGPMQVEHSVRQAVRIGDQDIIV